MTTLANDLKNAQVDAQGESELLTEAEIKEINQALQSVGEKISKVKGFFQYSMIVPGGETDDEDKEHVKIGEGLVGNMEFACNKELPSMLTVRNMAAFLSEVHKGGHGVSVSISIDDEEVLAVNAIAGIESLRETLSACLQKGVSPYSTPSEFQMAVSQHGIDAIRSELEAALNDKAPESVVLH